jgi:mxaK protein
MSAIEGGALDKAIPLTKLAKDDYRRALSLDPDFWDAKFNFDVAMRLVRDLPGYEQEGEEAPPDAKTRLWTDLPGVPRGLP